MTIRETTARITRLQEMLIKEHEVDLKKYFSIMLNKSTSPQSTIQSYQLTCLANHSVVDSIAALKKKTSHQRRRVSTKSNCLDKRDRKSVQ